MKYILISSFILLGCILLGIGVVLVINKIMKKKLKIYLNIIIASSITIVGLLIAFTIFAFDYYKADSKAYDYLESSDNVAVNKTDYGYFFDGVGTNDCIIFYPGAKVEVEAYAPLMHELANEGIDTFLIKMPINIAYFGSSLADQVINNYKYDNYYMCGHSLGGIVASKYTTKNDKIKGIIYLASYSTIKLNDDIKVLSLYGSNDKVLNIDEYNKNKKNWPSTYREIIIEGGNHAQFGFYNEQDGDGIANISNTDQINITKEEIIKFIKS